MRTLTATKEGFPLWKREGKGRAKRTDPRQLSENVSLHDEDPAGGTPAPNGVNPGSSRVTPSGEEENWLPGVEPSESSESSESSRVSVTVVIVMIKIVADAVQTLTRMIHTSDRSTSDEHTS